MWVRRVSYIVLVSLLVLELAPVISYALSSTTQSTPIQYEEYTLFLFNDTLVSGNGVVYHPYIFPVGILYDPYNGLVYVADNGNNTITVINPTTMNVVDTIDVNGGPFMMALDPNNQLIYVTLKYSNQVAVLNPGTNAIVDYIPVGLNPTCIIYAEGLIYVANSNNISVINPNTDQVINTISTPGIPMGLAFDPVNGMIYATTNNGVAVINPKTDSQVTTISLPFLWGVAVDPSTGYVYVAVAKSGGYVAVINPSTNTVVNKIVNGSFPTKIKIGGNLMFVLNSFSDTLTIVNLTDDDVVANIPVGNSPLGACIVGNSIYVTNSQSSSISIIRLNIQTPNVSVTTPITTTQTNNAHLFFLLLIVALIVVVLAVVIIIFVKKH